MSYLSFMIGSLLYYRGYCCNIRNLSKKSKLVEFFRLRVQNCEARKTIIILYEFVIVWLMRHKERLQMSVRPEQVVKTALNSFSQSVLLYRTFDEEGQLLDQQSKSLIHKESSRNIDETLVETQVKLQVRGEMLTSIKRLLRRQL